MGKTPAEKILSLESGTDARAAGSRNYFRKMHGRLSHAVYPKDLGLFIIGQITAEGATYRALEFGGEIENIDISGRLTLSNLSVEAGARVQNGPSETTMKLPMQISVGKFKYK